jgi:hypothetical protein
MVSVWVRVLHISVHRLYPQTGGVRVETGVNGCRPLPLLHLRTRRIHADRAAPADALYSSRQPSSWNQEIKTRKEGSTRERGDGTVIMETPPGPKVVVAKFTFGSNVTVASGTLSVIAGVVGPQKLKLSNRNIVNSVLLCADSQLLLVC